MLVAMCKTVSFLNNEMTTAFSSTSAVSTSNSLAKVDPPIVKSMCDTQYCGAYA